MCGDGEGDCSRDSDCSGSLVRFIFTLVLNFHFCSILVFGVVGDINFYFYFGTINPTQHLWVVGDIHFCYFRAFLDLLYNTFALVRLTQFC